MSDCKQENNFDPENSYKIEAIKIEPQEVSTEDVVVNHKDFYNKSPTKQENFEFVDFRGGTLINLKQNCERAKRGSKKKRNIWSSAEVEVFIELIKEKHTLGLMDGKRIRVGDIFKTLVLPMKQAGFHRDVSQLIVKWKNLKGDYYKCKRHNNPADFEYFEALDEILGQRPTTPSLGLEASQDQNHKVLTVEVEGLVPQVEETHGPWEYEDAPDVDGAIPGGSSTPGIRMDGSPSSSTTSLRSPSTPVPSKKVKPMEALLKMQEEFSRTLKEVREQEVEADREFLNEFLRRQEEMMIKCTTIMMCGLKEIFSKDSDNS